MFIDSSSSINSSTSLLHEEAYQSEVSGCNKLIVLFFYEDGFLLEGPFSTTKCLASFITKIALGTICMTLSGVAFGAAMQIGGGYHTFSILKWYALGWFDFPLYW